MMSKLDRVTLLNPRKVQNAALGYELMLAKFKIFPKNNEALFELLDQVQEYFTTELGVEKEQERHLHRLIMVSYLNDMNGFEKLGQLLRDAREHELTGATPKKDEVAIQADTGVTESIIYKQIEHNPDNKDLQPNELLKILIQAQMNPRMVPFANFHDDSILGAFNHHVRCLDVTLIKLSFLFENVCVEEREEPETAPAQLDTGSQKPEEEKKDDTGEEKKLDDADLKSVTGTEMDSVVLKRTPEVIKGEKEFIAL